MNQLIVPVAVILMTTYVIAREHRYAHNNTDQNLMKKDKSKTTQAQLRKL